MTRRLLAAAFTAWFCTAPACVAQLVQVGPGYVKAPFVRVYRYPDGSSFVRAPFVGVFTPGYGGYAHGDADNNFSFQQRCADLDWSALKRTIRDQTAELNADLDDYSGGDPWKGRLHLASLETAMKQAGDDAPAGVTRDAVQQSLAAMEAADQAKAPSEVTDFSSFERLQTALREYSQPAGERLRRQLMTSSDRLQAALRRFNTAEYWQKYLTLSAPAAQAEDESAETIAPEPTLDPAALPTALERFNKIAGSQEYSMIARLPEFDRTRRLLSAYIGKGQIPAPPPAEVLPTPEPDGDAS